MLAEELMLKLRSEDEFGEPLAGVVVLAGSGGPDREGEHGGACKGYVFVSSTPLPMLEIRQWINKNVAGEVCLQFVRSLS